MYYYYYLPFLLIVSIFYIVTAEEYPYCNICPNIITKDQWGGRAARMIEYLIMPTKFVIIHHTFTPSCNNKLECSDLLTSIQNFHMDVLNFDDIGYNFLIGGDGKIYSGRGWHIIGAHTKDYNSRSLSIAFIGTFSDKLPDNLQLEIAKNLIECGIQCGEISKQYKLFGARQLSKTKSPGLRLYEEIANWPHFTKSI